MSEGLTAFAVVEEMLLRTERAVVCGDFEKFLPCIRLPYSVETVEGTLRIDTPSVLQGVFEHMTEYYRRNGVTSMVRRCLEAEFRDPDTISGLYETRLVHFGQMLERRPFVTYVELAREAVGWQVTRAQYLIDDLHHNRALIRDPSSGGTPTPAP